MEKADMLLQTNQADSERDEKPMLETENETLKTRRCSFKTLPQSPYLYFRFEHHTLVPSLASAKPASATTNPKNKRGYTKHHHH